MRSKRTETGDGGPSLRGIGVSDGIVYGKVFVLDRPEVAILKERIAEKNVESEVKRLHEAIAHTERDLLEMRDKIEDIGVPSLPSGRVSVEAQPRAEAFDALVALGYKPNEVNKLLGKLDLDGLSAEDIIRLALKQVAA